MFQSGVSLSLNASKCEPLSDLEEVCNCAFLQVYKNLEQSHFIYFSYLFFFLHFFRFTGSIRCPSLSYAQIIQLISLIFVVVVVVVAVNRACDSTKSLFVPIAGKSRDSKYEESTDCKNDSEGIYDGLRESIDYTRQYTSSPLDSL